jgi:ABC-type transporter Mla subunit MlaD
VADIQAKLEAAEAAATAMSSTIEDRIKNMSVALGTAVPDKAATAQELVAQHAELETKFKASFKVGAPTKKAAEPAAKPLFTEAQLAAAKLIPVL